MMSTQRLILMNKDATVIVYLISILFLKRMKLSHRNLIQVAIKGKIESLLQVYLHVSDANLQWLNDNSDEIIADLCRVVTENIIDIEKIATGLPTTGGTGTGSYSITSHATTNSVDRFTEGLHNLPATDRFHIFYSVDKRMPSQVIIDYGISSSVTPKKILSIAKFSLLVWLLPKNSLSDNDGNDRSTFPVDQVL